MMNWPSIYGVMQPACWSQCSKKWLLACALHRILNQYPCRVRTLHLPHGARCWFSKLCVLQFCNSPVEHPDASMQLMLMYKDQSNGKARQTVAFKFVSTPWHPPHMHDKWDALLRSPILAGLGLPEQILVEMQVLCEIPERTTYVQHGCYGPSFQVWILQYTCELGTANQHDQGAFLCTLWPALAVLSISDIDCQCCQQLHRAHKQAQIFSITALLFD